MKCITRSNCHDVPTLIGLARDKPQSGYVQHRPQHGANFVKRLGEQLSDLSPLISEEKKEYF